jgi:hypothetical protein
MSRFEIYIIKWKNTALHKIACKIFHAMKYFAPFSSPKTLFEGAVNLA